MKQRTADHIRHTLEQAITLGEFGDGDRLDEVTLTEKFGVSRTPIREALQMLAASGLVELIPRRGAFVRYPDFVELVEMFEVMATLEAACGRLAASRASEGQIEALRKAEVACDAALKQGDTDAYYTANELFHHLLYEASGNRFLADEAKRLHRRLQPFRRLQLRLRGRMPQSMEEHRIVLDAIAAGDAKQAGEALYAHIAIQGEKFHILMAGYQKGPQRVELRETG